MDAARRPAPATLPAFRFEFGATLALAWPLVLGNLAQIAITTTDVVMMGRLGSEALAAGALGANLYTAVQIFATGLVAAAAPLMAAEIGRRRHAVREVRRTVRQAMWSAVGIAILAWIALWHAEAILRLLGQDPALAEDAGRYVRALQWSLLPLLGFTILRTFVAVLGRPIWGLLAGLVAVAVNAAANWTLMFGHFGLPRLELVGAGLASTLSCVVMFAGLALVVRLDRRFRRYRLFGRFWRADWPRLARLWAVGLPIAVTMTLEVAVFNAAVFLMGLIGAATVAAHSIAIQIASVSFMVPLGIGQAATIRVGVAYGRGDREAIARAGWSAFVLGVGFMGIMALFMISVPRFLIGLFLDLGAPDNVEVVALAVSFLGIAALFQVADGAQAVAAGMLRGLQDTRIPMLIAAFGYWGAGFGLALLLGFGLDLGGRGIWIGLAAALVTVAVLMLARWLMRERLGLTRLRPEARPG